MIKCAAVFPLNSWNFVHRFPHNYERCEERSTPESGHHLLVGNLAHNLKNLMNNEPFSVFFLLLADRSGWLSGLGHFAALADYQTRDTAKAVFRSTTKSSETKNIISRFRSNGS